MFEHKMKVQSITHFNVVFQAYKAFLLFNRHIIGVIIKTPDTRLFNEFTMVKNFKCVYKKIRKNAYRNT